MRLWKMTRQHLLKEYFISFYININAKLIKIDYKIIARLYLQQVLDIYSKEKL